MITATVDKESSKQMSVGKVVNATIMYNNNGDKDGNDGKNGSKDNANDGDGNDDEDDKNDCEDDDDVDKWENATIEIWSMIE